MIDLSVISFNYRKSSSSLRSVLALDSLEIESLNQKLEDHKALILQTCNRLDFFMPKNAPHRELIQQLAELKNIDLTKLINAQIYLKDKDALRYLFRLSSSLESMVVGEVQVLGQVKEAYKKQKKQLNKAIDFYFQAAFRCAKNVRSQSRISEFKISFPSLGLELAKTVFGDLSETQVAVIGTGKMGILAGKYFSDAQVSKLFLLNRTEEKGREAAKEISAEFKGLDQLELILNEVDITIFASAQKTFVLNNDLAKKLDAKRKGKPLFCIDLGIPNNVEDRVNDIQGFYVYGIDDFKELADEHKAQKTLEIIEAEKLLELELDQTLLEINQRQQSEAIKKFRSFFLENLEEHISELLPKKLEDEKEEIERLMKSFLEKKLHHPTLKIKNLKDKDPEQSSSKKLSAVVDFLFQKQD